LTGNLEAATSSVGGFCCGDVSIVYFQRLNSSGYVYSCSLPPLLATASIAAFDILEEEPQLLESLKQNVQTFIKSFPANGLVKITSSPISPLVHLRLTNPSGDRYQDESTLQKIVEAALDNGVFLTRAKYVHQNEKFLPAASIRVSISAALSKKQITSAAEVVLAAVKKASTK